MTTIAITRHAETRMSQRGIRMPDLDVLLAYATEMGEDRLILRARDAERAIGELKRKIAALQRLKNKVLVISRGSLVTTYHQSTRAQSSHGRRNQGEG